MPGGTIRWVSHGCNKVGLCLSARIPKRERRFAKMIKCLMLLAGLLPLACSPTSSVVPPSEAVEVVAPQGLVAQVGRRLQLEAKASGAVTWAVEDGAIASVEPTGRVTALSSGGVVITATTGRSVARSLIACVSSGDLSTRIRWPEGVTPNPSAKDSTSIINSQSDWNRFWTESLQGLQSKGAVPAIDFSNRTVIALVKRKASIESSAEVVRVETGNTPRITIVYPFIRNPGDMRPDDKVLALDMFEVPKVDQNAQVTILDSAFRN